VVAATFIDVENFGPVSCFAVLPRHQLINQSIFI